MSVWWTSQKLHQSYLSQEFGELAYLLTRINQDHQVGALFLGICKKEFEMEIGPT
jgi:hypothetical protein